MRKKELVKALSKIEEGIADIKNLILSIDGDSVPTDTKAGEDTTDSEDSVEGQYSKEELGAMKYNELKKLGKELGVNCKGTREEIIERIMNVPAESDGEDDSNDAEPVKEDEKVVPISKKGASKKSANKEEKQEDDEIEEQYLALAREALEDTELSEVIEVLEEVGIKLTAMQKKKEDVVMRKLAWAFQNGKIDTEDDGEDDSEVDGSDDEVLDENAYFEQYDPEGINDPSAMSKKRAKSVKSLVAEILEAVEKEELTTDDMEEELEDIITDDDIDLLGEDYSEDDLLGFYIEMKKRFIDDDGNTIDHSDLYEIGENSFCCGHELKYDNKRKAYVCAVCDEEYEE